MPHNNKYTSKAKNQPAQRRAPYIVPDAYDLVRGPDGVVKKRPADIVAAKKVVRQGYTRKARRLPKAPGSPARQRKTDKSPPQKIKTVRTATARTIPQGTGTRRRAQPSELTVTSAHTSGPFDAGRFDPPSLKTAGMPPKKDHAARLRAVERFRETVMKVRPDRG